MTRYLYGAAAQGIQQFIFYTNKLREIVGASELVEEICTTKFAEVLYPNFTYSEDAYSFARKMLKDDSNAILNAAGNIKYIFLDKALCQKVVREFPRMIFEFAPGVTLSQAVVEFNEGESFADKVDLLESRLREQRNKPMRSASLGIMGIERSRQTGLPVVVHSKPQKAGTEDDEELKYINEDAATWSKLYFKNRDKNFNQRRTTLNLCRKAFGREVLKAREIAFNISDMTGQNDWVAVIHADGNGLGQVVQKIGSDDKKFKTFSLGLDVATTQAAVSAYNLIAEKHCINPNQRISIRPIVLGGDDLTVVCRADLAIPFVKELITQFESNTRTHLGKIIKEDVAFSKGDARDCLTACAGIAFIKSSYPFYYGYELAEALCDRAKKDAKNKDSIRSGKELPQSCIMFHKVQDSFAEDFNDIATRELKPNDKVSFEFGPYYLRKKECRWTIDDLLSCAAELEDEDGNALKSGLRQWMTIEHESAEKASQRLDRLREMTAKDKLSTLNRLLPNNAESCSAFCRVDNVKSYPVYDVLAVHTIMCQNTND